MKVAPLLAQYLYVNKRLDLPGLGSFILDPSTVIEPETGKHNKVTILEGVSFERNTTIKDTSVLVNFISSQTGTMKALAAADLDSHLGLALQFLNIGKPFLLEGIGTLTKVKSGEFSFTPGLSLPASLKEQNTKEIASAYQNDESLSDYKSVFYARKKNMTWKKPVAILLLITGLAVAIWGGYMVYKKTITDESGSVQVKTNDDETVLVADTAELQKSNQVQSNQVAVPLPAGNYKFILETSDAKRAFSRLSKLKTFQWPAQMETKDSVSFTLYMLLPVTAADTSRVLDSLSRLNGKRVRIEQ